MTTEKTALSEPATVMASAGYVLVDHPAGVALTFTPAAALGTAEALNSAARQALDHDSAPSPVPIRRSVKPEKV